MPTLTRLLAKAKNTYLVIRYEWLRQPRMSKSQHMVVPLFRHLCFTRAEAVARCRRLTDYVYALPAGEALNTVIEYNPTQCFPLREPEKNDEHARLYVDADLREYVNASLYAEVHMYRKAYKAAAQLLHSAVEYAREHRE